MGRNREIYKKLVDVGFALADGRYYYHKGWIDPVTFKAGSKVDLAFDQSTSHTGIAVKLHGGQLVCLIDFVNKGLPSKEIYMEFLKEYVTGLVKGLDVQYVVYEDPVERSRTVQTRSILLELRGFIKTLGVTVPELEDARFVEINIGTWRKHFLKSPEYQGRRKKTELVKVATMEETLKRYPKFEQYADSFRSVPDSMDAVGILEGWTSEYFATPEMDIIRVNRCMTPIYSLSYNYCIEVVTRDNIREKLRDKFGAMVMVRGYRILAFNGEFNVADNALRASSNFNEYCVILITQRKDSQAVRWEAGVDLRPGEVYAVICQRSNTTNQLPMYPLDEEEREFWRHVGV